MRHINGKNPNRIKTPKGDIIFVGIIDILMLFALLIVAVPVLNVISSSFSSAEMVSAGKVGIFPREFSVVGYRMILQSQKLVIGYANTIFYTFFGTLCNLIMTTIIAYPLSRDDFKARSAIMKLFTITMYIGGGTIPTYLLMRSLGFINHRIVMILPGAISVYNMIVMRTYFKTNIPHELLESTKIDGCSDFRFLVQFAIPLSKAIIAVMTLFYGIGHWNDYFNAYLYLSDEKKYPLSVFFQLILGGIVTKGMEKDVQLEAAKGQYDEVLRYALIMVSCVPVWCAYPFVQKYFVKGVMIGSIKG